MKYSAYTDGQAGASGITVHSCGHIFAKRGRAIHRPNGRDDHLLFYVAKGTEMFSLDREVTAEEGSFILFRPGERQEHVCVSDRTAEFYYVHFTPSAGSDLLRFDSSAVCHARPNAKVCALFEEMIGEVQMKQAGSDKIVAGLLLSILGLLERSISSAGAESREYTDKIAFAVQHMNREYAAEQSLEDYAALCRMSKFHFLRVFRSITGMTPMEYRNRVRIEHAKELLEDTPLSVSEIGTRVGFSSPSYFCDAFKKSVGLSPIRYRESHVMNTEA